MCEHSLVSYIPAIPHIEFGFLLRNSVYDRAKWKEVRHGVEGNGLNFHCCPARSIEREKRAPQQQRFSSVNPLTDMDYAS